MTRFSPQETLEIERIWRALPASHAWSGWAAVSECPKEIWLFRRQQNWRRFPLIKEAGTYCLYDDRARQIACASKLTDIVQNIEAVPALKDH